jgi:hypothetical protein
MHGSNSDCEMMFSSLGKTFVLLVIENVNFTKRKCNFLDSPCRCYIILKSKFYKPLNPSLRLVTKTIIALAEKLIETLIDGSIVRDFYLNCFRQHKLRFSMEWESYLHPWIWMNHVGGRWNNMYSFKLGTFIQKCSDTVSRFGSILAISFTLKLGIYL